MTSLVPAWLSEADILALTLWGEGRGEPVEGRIAIACVIRNRVLSDLGHDGKPDWWGEGYRGVCLAPYQFSAWNATDPNRVKLDGLITQLEEGLQIGDDVVFEECRWIAEGVVAGRCTPRVGGATHYYSTSMAVPPAWSVKALLTARVGHHLFFTGVK